MNIRSRRIKQFVAVDLGRARLTAVALSVSRRGVSVGAHLSQPIPDDVDPLDTEWIGKWMGRTLKGGGLGRGPLIFTVARRAVSIKRMTLPTTAMTELPGMVAFRLRAELPFPTEDAAVDFSIVRQEGGQTELIAAAMRREALERLHEIAHHAGRKVTRVTIRPLATAALLGEIERDIEGSVLAVDLRDYGELEVVVDWNGSLRFSRGAEPALLETSPRGQRARELDLAEGTSFAGRPTPEPPSPQRSRTAAHDDDDNDNAADVAEIDLGEPDEGAEQQAPATASQPTAGEHRSTTTWASPAPSETAAEPDFALDHETAARIATEVRRSWMSYRVTDDAPDVQRIVVIGIDGLAGAVARRLRAELGRPAEVLLTRSGVTGENLDELGPAWPLVGVGLEYFEERDPLDFAHPKKAPDLAAARRRLVLGGVAALVCLGLLGWTFARREIDTLQSEYDGLVSQYNELDPRVWDLRRRQLRVEHLDRWSSVRVDWLDHMAYIADRLPPADEVILSGFSGSMEPLNVEGGKIETQNGVKRWQWAGLSQTLSVQFDGATIDRPASDRLRSRFVEDATYVARSIGSDAPNKDPKYASSFGLRLLSTVRSPLAPMRETERQARQSSREVDTNSMAAAGNTSDAATSADDEVSSATTTADPSTEASAARPPGATPASTTTTSAPTGTAGG